jgi:plastocyanin
MISAFARARSALVAVPLALSFAMAAMTASSALAADAAIKIDNFVFTPDTLEIAAGTTVTWTNEDDIPHAVGAKDLSWKSHAMDTGDTFTYTFTKAGTYDYFCTLHPHMQGKIVVK